MGKSSTLRFKHSFCIFLTLSLSIFGHGNCLVYPPDSGERIACELSYRAIEYRQGSHESQLIFDAAIKIGPNYAYAYYQKSVPFFKRGMLAEGMQLISMAIELDPKTYLSYRAYWYFQHRSYQHCIQDLESLYVEHQTIYASNPGGDMEMRLLLAMAYAQSDNLEKGIHWAQSLKQSNVGKEHLKGLYDHHCLGILYFKNRQYEKSFAELRQQIAFNPHFAYSYCYLGLIHQVKGEQQLAVKNFDLALSKYIREEGDYSMNIFQSFNLSKDEIISKIHELAQRE